MVKLNLGCDIFHYDGFINIDINENLNPKPDLLLDITKIDEHFSENSVDFIYAGHILEHFIYEESKSIIKKCYKILRPCRSMIIVVPDFDYCREHELFVDYYERIILADGAHKSIMTSKRLRFMLGDSGFSCYAKLDLDKVPYMIVSDTNNPKPDPWQLAFIATKF